MHDIKLVVFDCDGVMFDSLEANLRFYNHILETFKHPPMSEEELEYVHMHHTKDSVRYIFRHYPEDLAAASAFGREIDYTPFLDYLTMEADLPGFLALLRPRIKTAISTNRAGSMPLLLEKSGLADCFDMVVTSTDVKNPKPHPEALLKIMDSLGVKPENTIYIGDSQLDQEHSRSAGVPLIAFKNPRLEAEYHVDSFLEIVNLPPFLLTNLSTAT